MDVRKMCNQCMNYKMEESRRSKNKRGICIVRPSNGSFFGTKTACKRITLIKEE